MPPKLSTGYLEYTKGDALDSLNGAFKGDGSEVNAFRRELMELIGIYGGVPEHLGPQAAEFVGQLPYEGTFQYEDGYIGLHILTETDAALTQLLEEDDHLKKKARGESPTDADGERSVRENASEFDHDFNIDEKSESKYHDSAKGFEYGIDEKGISNSFYGGNSEQIEGQIRANADERKAPQKVEVTLLEGKAPDPTKEKENVPAKTAPTEEKTTPATPSSPVSKSEVTPPTTIEKSSSSAPAQQPPERTETPVRIEITAPDFSHDMPHTAFRSGMQWLADHLIAVASGTRKKESFPRLTPIATLPEKFEIHGVRMATVQKLVDGIRRKFSKLKSPTSGGMDGLMDILGDVDPRDPGGFDSAFGALKELTKQLRGDENPWQKPWNENGGGWQD